MVDISLIQEAVRELLSQVESTNLFSHLTIDENMGLVADRVNHIFTAKHFPTLFSGDKFVGSKSEVQEILHAWLRCANDESVVGMTSNVDQAFWSSGKLLHGKFSHGNLQGQHFQIRLDENGSLRNGFEITDKQW